MSKFADPIRIEAGPIANTNSVVYTVPADKELHVYSYYFIGDCDAGTTGTNSMHIDNGAAGDIYLMTSMVHNVVAAVNAEIKTVNQAYPQPLVLAAGYRVIITSSAATCNVSGGVTGELISV